MSMMNPNLVLIVEDEPKLAALLTDYIDQSGFRSHWLDNGVEVEKWVKDNCPDIILLDILLPGKDGMAICKSLRLFTTIPIIMVTARIEEIDRLLGLELGADDYVCKPFSPREVVARIKAVLRRTENLAINGQSANGFRIDEDRYEISVYGKVLDLTPVEFRLLKFLNAIPGKVLSRDQLLDAIYTDYRVVTDRTVDSHIKNIRKKLEIIFPEKDFIRSIYGVGYCLESTG
jgi:two-component system response regulator BaeR